MITFQRDANGQYQQDPDLQLMALVQKRAGYNLDAATIRECVVAARERIVGKLGPQANLLEDPYAFLNHFRDRTIELVEAERPYRHQLTSLATRMVNEHFGLDESLTFLMVPTLEDIETMASGECVPHQREVSHENQSALTKRRLTNAIIQGGSSSLDQLIHLYADEIREIDPSLFELQMHHHNLANAQFYIFNDVLAELGEGDELPIKGGVVDVRQKEKVEIHAKATTFPLLVHELSKGALEALALIGRETIDERRAEVESAADDPRLEGLDIFIGREIWQKLIRTSTHQGVAFYQDLQRLFELDPVAFHSEVRRRCATNR